MWSTHSLQRKHAFNVVLLQGLVMRRIPHPDFDRNLRTADQPYARCCGIRSGILCNHRQIRADQSHTYWRPVSKDDGDRRLRCNGIEVVELTAQEVTTWCVCVYYHHLVQQQRPSFCSARGVLRSRQSPASCVPRLHQPHQERQPLTRLHAHSSRLFAEEQSHTQWLKVVKLLTHSQYSFVVHVAFCSGDKPPQSP
jgi:hypothetical protein